MRSFRRRIAWSSLPCRRVRLRNCPRQSAPQLHRVRSRFQRRRRPTRLREHTHSIAHVRDPALPRTGWARSPRRATRAPSKARAARACATTRSGRRLMASRVESARPITSPGCRARTRMREQRTSSALPALPKAPDRRARSDRCPAPRSVSVRRAPSVDRQMCSVSPARSRRSSARNASATKRAWRLGGISSYFTNHVGERRAPTRRNISKTRHFFFEGLPTDAARGLR
jgi:hypothetical protein